jgi:hypothetical protein
MKPRDVQGLAAFWIQHFPALTPHLAWSFPIKGHADHRLVTARTAAPIVLRIGIFTGCGNVFSNLP